MINDKKIQKAIEICKNRLEYKKHKNWTTKILLWEDKTFEVSLMHNESFKKIEIIY